MCIFVADFLEVGRQLVDQQVQGSHLLFVAEVDVRLAEENRALVLRREISGQQMHVADDAERHLRVLLDGLQLAARRRTVDVDTVGAVPHEIHGNAIAAPLRHHAQHAILALAQQLQGTCLFHQTILSADAFIHIFHFVHHFMENTNYRWAGALVCGCEKIRQTDSRTIPSSAFPSTQKKNLD